ncbi:MAG: Peptidoglycan D,D-transpeptidase MrdA [Phycisphaerae bacterium]|nr:Peptidoglycan D,D-transpeptidase MrdA [Phycisphaerae bacterium]
MVEHRLRVIRIILISGLLLLVVRLVQLQGLQADYFQAAAMELLASLPQYLESVRGRIVDRTGRELAADEPAWRLGVHYALISEEEDYLHKLARKILRYSGHPLADAALVAGVQERLRGQREELWRFIAERSGTSPADLEQQRRQIQQRVEQIKQQVELTAGHAVTLAEELELHPLWRDVTAAQQIELQLELNRRFRWLVQFEAVAVQSDTRRVYTGGEVLAHVLGRLGAVTPETVVRRPFVDEPERMDLGGYRGWDEQGISGVEASAEELLRGRRGRVITYRDDRPTERVEPINGSEVTLTIDLELQKAIYELVRKQVAAEPDVPGGSVVVLDIATREVLALVSYPAYDPQEWSHDYERWRADTRHLPLQFRAVRSQYAPGSIVKPATVVAALASGAVPEHYQYECTGYLFPEIRNRWRCWRPAGQSTPWAHGLLDAEGAIKHSCNIFCYTLGQKLGVDGLCQWLEMFGVGRASGIELPEERQGILPTSDWLSRKDLVASPGRARNYAIGQGEMELTPLQAANLCATYASGVYQPVTLLRGGEPKEFWQLPVSPSIWQSIRRGMYAVVNEEGGTAVKYARLDHPDYVLCGKSGSAETSRWITACDVFYQEAGQQRRFRLPANTVTQAREEFSRLFPELKPERITPAAYWPTGSAGEGRRHSHAWFIGYLQRRGPNGRPAENELPCVAIAVLLEFGGSGGRASGPLCRDVARTIIEQFPQFLQR